MDKIDQDDGDNSEEKVSSFTVLNQNMSLWGGKYSARIFLSRK